MTWWAIASAFSVLLNFTWPFITWHPPLVSSTSISLPLSLLSLSVSLNLEEWVGCVGSSNLSVSCVGKSLKRQLVNSWYRMERLGRMLCVCLREGILGNAGEMQCFSKLTLCVRYVSFTLLTIQRSMCLQILCYIWIEIFLCYVDNRLF